jgi:hypothetical protein
VLKKIADELLADRADEIKPGAARRLYSLLSSVSGLDENSDRRGDCDATRLPKGEAISPRDAAACLLDAARTSKFLRGLHAAVLEAQKRFPGATIEILYAGCGPFAPMAILLTTRFSSAEIRFTLLDIHQRSLDSARLIFETHGKGAFVRDYIQADAALYRHEASHVIHIVVVEAMQAALEKEPQVAITMNLAPQLCPGGIFIPERITIGCYLCHPAKELVVPGVRPAHSLSAGGGGSVRLNLGPVLELDARPHGDLLTSGKIVDPAQPSLTPQLLKIPGEVESGSCLMLSTVVTVFGSITLQEYESGLTYPKFLWDVGRIQPGQLIEFAYQLGDKPGFKYRSL